MLINYYSIRVMTRSKSRCQLTPWQPRPVMQEHFQTHVWTPHLTVGVNSILGPWIRRGTCHLWTICQLRCKSNNKLFERNMRPLNKFLSRKLLRKRLIPICNLNSGRQKVIRVTIRDPPSAQEWDTWKIRRKINPLRVDPSKWWRNRKIWSKL